MSSVLDISKNSSYVSKIVEYQFISNVAMLLWRRGEVVEILRQDVDSAGYDLVLECNGIVRHIQLKSSWTGAKTGFQKVHIGLQQKASACIVWILYDRSTLEVSGYRLFSNGKESLKLDNKPKAKHTKGNSKGVKAERPNIVKVQKKDFRSFRTEEIATLVNELFPGVFSAADILKAA